MYAVLLAGGNGRRLRPTWSSVPKCMLPYFDRPVLEHHVERLAAAGVRDIVISTSHEAVEIPEYFGNGSRWNVRISYSIEREPLGTAGAVKNIRNLLTSTFLVIYADTISDLDIAYAVREHERSEAIASLVLSDRLTDGGERDVVYADADGRVSRFLAKSENLSDGGLAFAGILVCEPDILSTIPYFERCEFATQVWPRLLNNRERVHAISLPAKCYHISSQAEYRLAHVDALEGRFSAPIPGVQTAAGVWIGEDAQVDPETIIHPPVFIGGGSVVARGAEIGAFAVVGAECVIGSGARVSRTMLGARSRVGNGAQLTGSVLGGGIDTPAGETISAALSVAQAVYYSPAPRSAYVPRTAAGIAQEADAAVL